MNQDFDIKDKEKQKSPEISKLISLFKEETWTKTDPKAIGPGTFAELKDIIQSVENPDDLAHASEIVNEQLESHPDSLYGQFISGLITLQQGKVEGPHNFKKLIELYRSLGKWANVEYLANLVLEHTENRYALKALASAQERLGNQKEAMQTWETLARVDTDDADIAQKVAESLILEGNDIKGLFFIRQALEANIRKRDFHKLDSLWTTFLEMTSENIAYIEKIEKMLTDARGNEKLSQLLQMVLDTYKEKGNEEMCIPIMKNILKYTPLNYNIRNDLIEIFEKKYTGHSRLDDILAISRIKDFKKPAGIAIEEFERHIALEINNYVFHRSWGVGKIINIEKDSLFIDFKDKENHRMAIEMALPSLQPLPAEHIWVRKAKGLDEVKQLLKDDLIQFFELLFTSFNKKMVLADIKVEICPDFLSIKDWSKWWTKARNLLKKEPKFGISVKKRDEFFLREKPITFSEDILSQFERTDLFDKRIDIAHDFVTNASEEDIMDATLPHLVDYFNDVSREKGATSWLIAALFILHDLFNLDETNKNEAPGLLEKVRALIKEGKNIETSARGIQNQEIKKRFLQLIQESRPDWPEIFTEVLFETPIKIHKFILSELNKKQKYEAINNFIEKAIAGYKESPEIFLWTAKNLFQNVWSGPWLNYSSQDLLLYLMRLMLQLPRIEPKGTKLKNSSVDILVNENFQIIRDAMLQGSNHFITKIMDLARGLSILDENLRLELQDLAVKERPDLSPFINREVEEEPEATPVEDDDDKIFVSQPGYDKKIQTYGDIVKNQLPAISEEIGKAASYGDLRENAEYKAALEMQGTLKASVTKLKEDIKKAKIQDSGDIDISKVGFGVKIKVMNLVDSKEESITILGPWDADHSKDIISYKAPLGRAFLGKQVGETVDFQAGDANRKYKILELSKAY